MVWFVGEVGEGGLCAAVGDAGAVVGRGVGAGASDCGVGGALAAEGLGACVCGVVVDVGLVACG